MVAALAALWPADASLEGLVLTRYHHTPPSYAARPGRIELREASHPVPDAAGLRGAQDMLARVQSLSAEDLVIELVSGGGSALLSLRAPGITGHDAQGCGLQADAVGQHRRFQLACRCALRGGDRRALEQLCRYITRPALADERVQTNAAGQVVLKVKTPRRDGTKHLVMSPLEFIKLLIQRPLCGRQIRRCYVSRGS